MHLYFSTFTPTQMTADIFSKYFLPEVFRSPIPSSAWYSDGTMYLGRKQRAKKVRPLGRKTFIAIKRHYFHNGARRFTHLRDSSAVWPRDTKNRKKMLNA